ncbi:D-alanyl-D-alanine carboxypeptidase [Streptomyces hundungensis]|uniref:D-alanyl-D-alanine carboxypeptidase n=1 Tax=Streptomyces hundungensis TaxID=1077946 RepID=A0A387HME8_9ACTN|nr:D-alanyl-D-alanine carboxypeptidase [Streptomyces hundungensis]AYG84689.1 D-alanyl-D-alanine carboxypeptidase [Streptomyces hundungensis]
MNEKNSTKAADVSGASATPGEDDDAVSRAEVTEPTRGEASPAPRTDPRAKDAALQEAQEVANSGLGETTSSEGTDASTRTGKVPNSDPAEPSQDEGTEAATRPASPSDDPDSPNSGRPAPTSGRTDAVGDAARTERTDRADRADKTLVGASATPPKDSAHPGEDTDAPHDDVREGDAVDTDTDTDPDIGADASTGTGTKTGAKTDAKTDAVKAEAPEASAKSEDPAPRASKPASPPVPPTAPASPDAPVRDSAAESPSRPTTPSWAARSARTESDSEQTSEFVALKPDLPHPTPPRRSVPAPPLPSSAQPSGRSLGEPETTRELAAPPADDRTMALTRPAGPAAAGADRAPETASGTGDAGGPPPPLDLLAQLTNTPPKPETVARTVGRRIKIWGTLVALLVVALVAVQALRPLPAPQLVLTAKASHTAAGGAPSLPWPSEGQAVVDIDGLGRMGSYGEMRPLPIGSVAKVMTAYLILRNHPLKAGEKGPMIPVDQKAQDDYTNGVKEKESVVEVKAGQQLSELEALQAVMLPSANNVARLLARWDASTEAAFIQKMNDTAKQFGMANTTYTDASGLVDSTVSTAEDQVKLAKRAMADPVFRGIAKLPAYASTTTSGGGTVETSRTQRNFNKLVPLYGVVGIKTGSTTKAGGNLLFAAEKTVGGSKQLIVGAVFGQHRPNIIETATVASKNLILAAGGALRSEMVVKKGEVVGRVEDGLGGTVPVVATKDLSVPVWTGASVGLSLTDGGKKLPHTAKAGTEVGTLTVGGGIGEVKVPVALKDDLAEPSFASKLTRLG